MRTRRKQHPDLKKLTSEAINVTILLDHRKEATVSRKKIFNRDHHQRRAKKRSELGLEFEDFVEKILEKMVEENLISGFTHHAHNSHADRHGKDFTVIKNGQGRSFGVTISLRSWSKSKQKYPYVTQLCFPRIRASNPKTIRQRVMELFETDN